LIASQSSRAAFKTAFMGSYFLPAMSIPDLDQRRLNLNPRAQK
jgi:hypothetical protein